MDYFFRVTFLVFWLYTPTLVGGLWYLINTYLRYFWTLLLEVNIYILFHDYTWYGYLYLLQYKSECHYSINISYWSGKSVHQRITRFETDWWGKYTSGILIQTNVMSMELFTVVLCYILHGWMEEYNSWLFTGLWKHYILLFVE